MAGTGQCQGLLGAVLAIPLLAGLVGAQQRSAQAGGELAEKTVRQIEALLAAKAERTPAQRKVSSQLLPARRAQAYGIANLRDPGAAPADEMTMVDIRADVTSEVLGRIRELGGTVISNVPQYRAIRANLPIAAAEQLAVLDAVQSIRPADMAVTRAQEQGLNSKLRSDTLGNVVTRVVDTSEGDVAHRANVARSTHSVDGTGIGIGVISDGIATLAAQQATGDVPSRVTVLHGQEGDSISYRCGGTSNGSEGTAMLEIVHDLAPGAELFFATGINGSAQMAQNITNLCAAGANVIVDDIGYLAASVFQDDVISQAVSSAVANGCYYFSSAGNGGNKNDDTAGVWEGDFAAGSTLSVNGVAVGTAHDFGGGVTRNRIKRNSTSSIYLQWADPEGGSANDYDLFLVDADDNVLASSTSTQDGTQDPLEGIRGSCSNDREDTRLVIVKTTGAADRYLRLDYAQSGLEITTAGSTFGHSASKDAVGVAAVDVRTAGGADGVFDGTESVRTSSSDGPRRIFFEADGTPITAGNFSSTGGELLQKPDLAAATCVSTSTPGLSTFCGTSAAAPHAAAIATLMLEAAGGPGNVTPSALRTAMTGAALDIEATGTDRDSGAGIVMAPGAVDAVDVAMADRNEAPKVESTLADRTLIQGAGSVTVNVASSFSEPDNQTLTYNALSSDTDRVSVTRSGSQLTLTPGLPGLAEVMVRATDPNGLSAAQSFMVTVASPPPPPEGWTYYFPHLAVGAGWQTTLTYINSSSEEVTCRTEFISDDGAPLLVSFPGRAMVVERNDALPPRGSVHEETDVALSAPAVAGWARATCTGPVKASLLYRRFEAGVPTGEAGVNATTVPATRFVTFAEQGEGQLGTGVAYANPSDTTTAFVTFTVRNADGQMLARSTPQTLLPRGHDAKNMKDLVDLASFTGWLEITSTQPIVSLSINAEAAPVFSSLPPGEVERPAR